MNAILSRRAALGAGLFVALAARGAGAQNAAPTAAVTPTNLANPPVVGVDGLLALHPDGRWEVLTSKTEFGQGIAASFAQIVAEELDLEMAMVSMPHADTDRSPDHGVTAGSLSLQIVGPRLRLAAATARAALLAMAAERLGVPAATLETAGGTVRPRGAPERAVTYAALLAGRRFELAVDAQAPVKPRAEWRVAGQPVPRPDLLAKVTGQGGYVHDLRLPGMLHARVVHPPRIGAKLVSFDAGPVAAIPGVRVVRRGDLLAVVAEREWLAVKAARALRAEWDAGTPIPAMAAVHDAAKRAGKVRADTTVDRGDPAAAIAGAARKLEAEYRFNVQTHGTLGPSCAVAAFEAGRLTIHSGSQAPFDLRAQVAHVLGLATQAVRVVYHHSSGCFGRNGLEDAAAECAVLAMEVAPRPVRLQWMRADEFGNEPKAPPTVMTLEGGTSAEGRMLGWSSETWVPHATSVLVRTTAASALGRDDGPLGSGNWHANSNPPYDGIGAAKSVAHRIAETPFRPSWIRTPGRMQNNFAVEGFTDELAAAADQDPVAFRLAHLSDPRGRAVIEAAARAAAWQPRPSPAAAQAGAVRRGRGMAYIRYDNTRTYVAVVMAVEVNLAQGTIRATDCWLAQDCGQVINPDGIRQQAEGCIIHTLSRTLSEEITWDGNAITSLDWASYPILRFSGVPRIEVVILDRPDQPMWGAGEPAVAVIPAAVANAVFDATGLRLREAPMTPARVQAAARAQRLI
jgi:CO/xanthine dehydrogenase Mo-binding subunit